MMGRKVTDRLMKVDPCRVAPDLLEGDAKDVAHGVGGAESKGWREGREFCCDRFGLKVILGGWRAVHVVCEGRDVAERDSAS